jgi:hypothetical protein
MSVYVRNKACPCQRCKTKGLLGAAILITLGVLFLLDNLTRIDFWDVSPVLLIVIGVILYLGQTAPTEGHIPPYYQVGPVASPPAPAAPPQPNNSQVNQ